MTELAEAADGRSLVVTATPRPEGGHVVAVDDVSHVLQLEQRYRALFGTVPVAIFTLDGAGLMRSVNPAARALGGFTDAAPAGRIPHSRGAGLRGTPASGGADRASGANS